MKALFINALFLTTLFFTTAIQPKIFQWVDEKGIKHFSDRPKDNRSEDSPIDKGPTFIPLAKDIRPASEKLKVLQGEWLQTNSSPSKTELMNLMSTLWGMPRSQQAAPDELVSVLTVKSNRISLQNKPSETVIQTNTYKEKERLKYAAKLEFYNAIPLEVGGYWSFEKGFNPVVKGFLDQIEANNNMWKHSEQVRFDIQANKLMVTVKLPTEFKTPLLKIIYEKQYRSAE